MDPVMREAIAMVILVIATVIGIVWFFKMEKAEREERAHEDAWFWANL